MARETNPSARTTTKLKNGEVKKKTKDLEVTPIYGFHTFSQPARVETLSMHEAERAISDQNTERQNRSHYALSGHRRGRPKQKNRCGRNAASAERVPADGRRSGQTRREFDAILPEKLQHDDIDGAGLQDAAGLQFDDIHALGPPNEKTQDVQARTLKANYKYCDDEKCTVHDARSSDVLEKKVVAYINECSATMLPVSNDRLPSESNISCTACQALHSPQASSRIPGWICGTLKIPPKGIKDAEGVGLCSQIFVVGDCQARSVEFALACPEKIEFDPLTAQRFLLSKGSFFQIPPNNIYRVENHSEASEAVLHWTIVRPIR